MKNMTVKKWLGLILKIGLALVAAVFAGSESMNFFNFVFPATQWYLSYTAFAMTMGAMFVYLYLLLNDAETPLQRTVALIMMLVGLGGEILSAGFGMQIESWKKAGFVLAESDFDFMILAVRIMIAVQGLALMLYWTGDQIFELLKDDDKDGKPNYRDNDYKSNKRSENRPQQQQAYSPPKSTGNNAPNQGQGTQYTLPAFLSASGMNTEQAFGEFLDETETFTMAWKVLRDGSSQDGYKQPPGITHSNFNDLAGKVRANGNFTNAAPSNSNHRR